MKRSIALLATFALVLTACGSGGETASTVGPDDGPNRPDNVALIGGYFQTFDNCDALLDYYIEKAVDVVGPWGFGGNYYFGGPVEFAVDDAVLESAADGAAPAAGGNFTGTNVQVTGVDEGDFVKTDGERIFTIADTGLEVAVVTNDGVEFTDRLRLDWYPQSMLLHDDTLVLMGVVWGDGFGYGNGSSTTKLVEVDVSDPSDISVIRTLEFDGSFVSARLVGSELRVAVNSSPVGLAFETPQGSGLRSERDATQANIAIIEASDLDNWLPYYVLDDNGSESEGRLLDCTSVMAPNTFAGIDTLSLLTFDLAGDGVAEWDSAGVVATGATMYANEDRTYLATGRWMNWALFDESDIEDEIDDYTTDIHAFDTTGPSPEYIGSGTVTGFLLNQFAMDEYEGHLRVATTSAPQWWGGGSFESQSRVTVLAVNGGDLEEVGMVDGLGKTEQIYSVRFMGDTGYVVTFRQTDPLYVVDLSDPSDPAVVGELKIPGYSAYLHPVGDGLLLGIGQDASETGATQGTQVSLFDVSDPTNPQRLDSVMVEDAWSAVEGDHRAFTFTDGVGYVPFESWKWSEEFETESFDNGVMAVTVGADSLELTTILRPVADGPIEWSEQNWQEGIDPWQMMTRRTIRIDDRIYLVTHGGIAVFDVDGYDRIEYEKF